MNKLKARALAELPSIFWSVRQAGAIFVALFHTSKSHSKQSATAAARAKGFSGGTARSRYCRRYCRAKGTAALFKVALVKESSDVCKCDSDEVASDFLHYVINLGYVAQLVRRRPFAHLAQVRILLTSHFDWGECLYRNCKATHSR